MRKISYLIDDKKGFKKNLPEEQQKYLNNIKGFSAYYTLQEDEEGITYQLEDLYGKKLDIDDLNGYEKTYIHECFDNFCGRKVITKEYKDFITILDEPRIIKPSVNIRYELFKEYAKVNNIEDRGYNYIKFIDKFSNEFEAVYNESSLSKPKEFDNFIRDKVFSIIKEKDSKQYIRNMFDIFYKYLECNSNKMDILKQSLTKIMTIEDINKLETEDIVEWILEEKSQLYIGDEDLNNILNDLLDENINAEWIISDVTEESEECL